MNYLNIFILSLLFSGMSEANQLNQNRLIYESPYANSAIHFGIIAEELGEFVRFVDSSTNQEEWVRAGRALDRVDPEMDCLSTFCIGDIVIPFRLVNLNKEITQAELSQIEYRVDQLYREPNKEHLVTEVAVLRDPHGNLDMKLSTILDRVERQCAEYRNTAFKPTIVTSDPKEVCMGSRIIVQDLSVDGIVVGFYYGSGTIYTDGISNNLTTPHYAYALVRKTNGNLQFLVL